MPKKIDPRIVDAALGEYRSGVPLRDIAAKYAVSHQSIANWATRDKHLGKTRKAAVAESKVSDDQRRTLLLSERKSLIEKKNEIDKALADNDRNLRSLGGAIVDSRQKRYYDRKAAGLCPRCGLSISVTELHRFTYCHRCRPRLEELRLRHRENGGGK